MDDILNSQRYPAIKIGLGFHESIEGESSSQGKARNSKEKSKMINKEMRDKPHQQPRKEILQRKYFTPPMNNVECYVVARLEEVGFKTIMQKDYHIQGTLMDIALLAICLVTELLIAI